jgi:lysine 6-dehydrogenase
MGYAYTVLGAGRQGVAIGYDLALHGEAETLVLADSDLEAAERARSRLDELGCTRACEIRAMSCDVLRSDEVAAALAGARVAVSAVPFRFNVALTDAAIEAGASFCDLGGNTGVVREQLARHEAAARRGVSIVPDCGLAPGLGNHLAAHGVESLEEPRHVRIRCGGLPERPVGPLGYKLLFNFEGLINEYSGAAEVLRGGQRALVPALSEVEEVDMGPPLGVLEAAITSGGTSTCTESWLGRLETCEYKTLRYSGHWRIVRTLFELGCFEPRVELEDGLVLEPRAVMRALFERALAFPEVRDLAVLRVAVSGRHGGRDRALIYDVLERWDAETGFSAMERATAFPAALVAHLQARGLVAPGARPLELSVPAGQFLQELPGHGIAVRVRSEGA